MVSKEELVGQNRLIYRINGQYYKEHEAWPVILSNTAYGNSDVSPLSPIRTRIDTAVFKNSSDSSKPIRSFRPSTSSLAMLDLNYGENELIYEYCIAEGILQQIKVKVYLFSVTDKIVVSDIDGTITK